MRAMVMPRFGGPELFEERDLGRPEPGPEEVLVTGDHYLRDDSSCRAGISAARPAEDPGRRHSKICREPSPSPRTNVVEGCRSEN